jgi:hypothetical protein
VDYTKLTINEVRASLERTVADVRTTFGHLDARQLNWRADPASWSVAQCLDHLVNANREMCGAIASASDPARPRTIWQKLPFLPGLFGRLMVTSMTPKVTRKFTAPPTARPSASDIDEGVVDRFVDTQSEVMTLVRKLAGRDPAQMIMVSPFVRFITYSVLDGLRLIAAHERRHFEQARRVMAAPGFPK